MILYLYATGILLSIITLFIIFAEDRGLELKWYNYWITLFWPIFTPLIFLYFVFLIYEEKKLKEFK
jgi:hypothetical protein